MPSTFYFVGDGVSDLWSGTCWAFSSGVAPVSGPPSAGDDAVFDNMSPTCNLDVDTPLLNDFDCAAFGAFSNTFNQNGYTISVDRHLYLSAAMTLNHGNGKMLITGMVAGAELLSAGKTIGALQIDDGGGGGSVVQTDDLSVAGDVTFTSGAYTNTYSGSPKSLTVGGTIFYAANDSVDLNIVSCAVLDCTGATGTLTQNDTWTITGATFKLVAGMTFTHNNNLVDFTYAAGTVQITTAGKTLGAVRTGNAGAGGLYRQMDAITVAGDLTLVNGAWDSDGSLTTVGGTIYFSGGSASFDSTTTAGSLDCTGATGTLSVSVSPFRITGTLFKMVPGMTFNNLGGVSHLFDFTATAGTVQITTAGKTLGSVRFGNAGTGATYQQQDAMTLTGNFGLANGNYTANGFALTIPTNMTLYYAGSGSLTLNVTATGSLDCNGATGTLTLLATLTVIGGTLGGIFRLVAGMNFTHNNNLVDFTATAGTMDITSGGKTVGNVRFGNAGAGGTFRLQDALAATQDATLVNGTFQTNNKNFTIGRDLTLSATMGANSVVSGSATVTIGRHLTTNTTAAWHSYGTSLWKMPGDGTWTIAFGAGNNTQFYDLYIADAGKVITVNWQNSAAFVINHRMTTGSGSMLKAGTSRGNNIQFNAGTSGITDQFHPDPGFTATLAGALITFETGGGAAPVTIDLYPCTLSVTPVLGSGGNINFQSLGLNQNVIVRAMGNITWNADSGFLFSFNDSGSGGAMTKVLDTNGYNISFLGSALINGRDGVNGRAWKFNVADNTTLRLAGYQEYFANIAANRTSVLGNNSVFQVDGNYVYLGGGAGSDRRYTMTATSVIQISGSYSGAAMNTWVGSNTGIVKFTSNAAWSITQNAADQWPNIQITGSGAASIGIFNMASLDCTGASGTITQTGTWTVRTTTFKLVAAQTLTHNNNLIDFTATAGTVAITTGGKTVGNVRFGNAGAGSTFQLQDAMTVAQDANFINGIFQTGNNNLTVRDLLLAGTMGVNSFVPGSATVTVGRTFTLVTGAWSTGTCLLDLVATAGTSAITTAGNTLYSVRCGNAGAGGTFQLQDAMTTVQDVDCVQGTFQANNVNLNVGRDLYFRATMGAAGFVAGSSTIVIPGNLNWLSANLVLSAGTSTFNFTGTGALALAAGVSGGLTISFYNLTVAAAGKVTSVTGTDAGGEIDVLNIFLASTGTFTYAGAGTGLRVTSTLANGFQPNAACVLTCPIILQPRAIAGTTVLIPAHTNTGSMGLIRDLATYGTCGFQVTGTVATGALTAYGIASAGVQAPTLDLNGNNWTVTGAIALGSGANGMGLCTIGAATLSMTGNLTMVGNPNADSRVLVLGAGGQLLVGGSLQHTGAVATTGQSFVLSGTSSITVGGNWDTAAVKVWPSLNGTVTFTAAGPFTVAESAADIFPNVRVTGGGSSTLPNGFACNIFTITAGLVTAGNPFIVYGTINNGGTLTVSPGTYVGGGITNTGTVISAGSNIFCRGSVCTLTGFNPNNVTMTKDCTELILGSSMTIAGALTVQARPQPPGVIRFLAGGVFAVANLNSQINCTDDAVQMISTVGGTRYNLNVAVLTNAQNLWFRDCNYTGPALVGDLTNINLGNNSGLALNIAPAAIRIDSEDPGLDLLAIAGIGQYSYCWLVDSTLIGLTAKAAAFGTGSNNWHRKTNIPQTLLNNLVLSNTYFIALGLIDDRNRRLVPNVAGGDRISAVANISESGGGGGGKGHLSVNVQIPTAS